MNVMEEEVEKKLEQTVWAARSLFERRKTAGSTANISFRHGDHIYISGSGTCFGTLRTEEFAVMDLSGRHVDGPKPSKEFPLHQTLYDQKHAGAVIHIHSFYASLWSCLKHADSTDVMPDYTPYLRMKVGSVGVIPYAPPGSEELFCLFSQNINASDGFLLQNHGPIVGGEDIMSAFFAIEELEESARTAWELRKEKEENIWRIR